MGVIIQEMVGRKYDHYYYPHYSGVARSFNYYPFGDAQATDGIVNLALGLGKTIVDGGVSAQFCPVFPTIMPQFATRKDYFSNSQKKFYAVDLSASPLTQKPSEDENLAHLDVRVQDAAEALQVGRQRKVVELRALEVAHEPAADAREVMVPLQVRVEPHAVSLGPERRDEAEVVESPESPVDRVERDRRHPLLHGAEDGLHVGVLVRPRDLPEDLEALGRQLQPRLSRRRPEALEPLLGPVGLGLAFHS